MSDDDLQTSLRATVETAQRELAIEKGIEAQLQAQPKRCQFAIERLQKIIAACELEAPGAKEIDDLLRKAKDLGEQDLVPDLNAPAGDGEAPRASYGEVTRLVREFLEQNPREQFSPQGIRNAIKARYGAEHSYMAFAMALRRGVEAGRYVRVGANSYQIRNGKAAGQQAPTPPAGRSEDTS